jgi:hypothetical protein
MTPETLVELKNNEIVQKRLAKFMAQFCFRNSKLEDLHNRISDDEMKELMIDVVNRSYAFIWAILASQGGNGIIELLKDEANIPSDWKHWNEPEMPKELIKAGRLADRILKSRASKISKRREKRLQTRILLPTPVRSEFDSHARLVEGVQEPDQLPDIARQPIKVLHEHDPHLTGLAVREQLLQSWPVERRPAHARVHVRFSDQVVVCLRIALYRLSLAP